MDRLISAVRSGILSVMSGLHMILAMRCPKAMAVFFVVGVLLVAAPELVHASQWEFEQILDEFGDNSYVPFVTLPPGQPMRRLEVYCQIEEGSEEFEAFVEVGVLLTIKNSVRVRSRFDGRPLTNENWLISGNGEAAYSPRPDDLSEVLMAETAVVFEIQDYRGQFHRARFPLAGSQAAIKQVRLGCGLDVEAPTNYGVVAMPLNVVPDAPVTNGSHAWPAWPRPACPKSKAPGCSNSAMISRDSARRGPGRLKKSLPLVT